MNRINAITVCFFALFITSCQQEISDIIAQNPGCKVATGLYYDGSGVINDSALFTYDANGRIIKQELFDGYTSYSYSGNNISVRKFFDMPGNQLWYLDSIKYDGLNNVSEMITYDYSGMWSPDTLMYKTLFYYTAGKLSKTAAVEYFDIGSGPQSDTVFTDYVWIGGNIDKMVFKDDTQFAFDSISFMYNNHPNYFKALHPHFYLFDPRFQLFAGFEPHLAFFYSTNNVINVNSYGIFDNPINYDLDSTNKITGLKMGGSDYVKYLYTCQ